MKQKLIKEGTFLYDKSIICHIKLYETDFLPGSGDYEDPPEISDDRYGKFYLIEATGAGTPNVFNNLRFYETYTQMEEETQKLFDGLAWKE